MTNSRIIYLDNNATTKVDKKVVEAMLPYFSENYGNPSSMYELGGKNSKVIQESRETIKEFFGAKNAKEILFTASGSESANTAIRGILSADRSKNHLITTKVEHPCVLNLHKQLEKEGYKITYIGVNSIGEINEDELYDAVNEKTALVSCMYANNETGTIFPVEEIAEKVKSKNRNTKIFVDAVQTAGKIKLDVQNTEIDFMGISGHKFHAPKGIGALYIKSPNLITPLVIGGH